MLIDQIGPRRANWRDWQHNWRLRERELRQWHNRIGYGETWLSRYAGVRYMSGSVREEIIKCFEQYTHMCSGLGESMMYEIVRRYFNMHRDRAPGVYVDHTELEQRPYMPPRQVVRAAPRQQLPR